MPTPLQRVRGDLARDERAVAAGVGSPGAADEGDAAGDPARRTRDGRRRCPESITATLTGARFGLGRPVRPGVVLRQVPLLRGVGLGVRERRARAGGRATQHRRGRRGRDAFSSRPHAHGTRRLPRPGLRLRAALDRDLDQRAPDAAASRAGKGVVDLRGDREPRTTRPMSGSDRRADDPTRLTARLASLRAQAPGEPLDRPGQA